DADARATVAEGLAVVGFPAADIGAVSPRFRAGPRAGRRPWALGPSRVRAVTAAGPPAGAGWRAGDPGEHGPRAELGHPRRELHASEEPAPAAAGPGRCRPARRPGGNRPAGGDARTVAGRVRPHAEDQHG